MVPLTPLGIILICALLCERLTEYVVKSGVNGAIRLGPIAAPIPVLLSLLLAQLFAWAFGLDVFAVYGIVARVPWLAIVLTGILIGGGSQLLNDVGDAVRAVPNKLS